MLQPEVLTSSRAGVVGHRSKASRTPSQSASPEHPPNAGAAAARVRAPTMTRLQANRLLKRVMVYFLFLSAEGSPSSVASAKREREVAGLVPPKSPPSGAAEPDRECHCVPRAAR